MSTLTDLTNFDITWDDTPVTAADDHWKRQPRDLSGDDAGQWVSGPPASDLGSVASWELSYEERKKLDTAWTPIMADLVKRYGEYRVSDDAPAAELTSAVRRARVDAGMTRVSTRDAASIIQQVANQGGLHQLSRRVSNYLDETSTEAEPGAPVSAAEPPPRVADDDDTYPLSSPPPLEFTPFDYEEGVPSAIFGGDKTSSQQRAISHYTGASYEEYTMYLRGQRPDVSPGVARSIEHIRAAMAPTPRDVTLFRYVDPDAFGPDVTLDNIVDRLAPGTEMTDPSFVSTGIDEDMLYLYSRSVLMQIEAPAGTPMVYVGDLTANEDDDGEMILKDGLRYRTVGAWRDSRHQVTVRVRVVP